MTATGVGLATSADLTVSSYDIHTIAHANMDIHTMVIAYSCAGLSTSASSDGILVDASPPGTSEAWVHEIRVLGKPLAGLCAGADSDSSSPMDAEYQSSPTLSICWGGFDDEQSGILNYQVGVSWSWRNSTNRAQVVNTDMEGVVEVLASSQHFSKMMNGAGHGVAADEAPAAGTIFYSRVNAINRALLVSEVVRSNGTVYDPTPPITGIVHDIFLTNIVSNGTTTINSVATDEMEMQMGDMKDINCQPSNTTIAAQWERFADAESTIAFFEWAVGSSPGADDVQPFIRLGAATATAMNPGLNLEVGSTYYSTVRATNYASLSSTSTSNGVVISPNYAGGNEICVPAAAAM
jgi:hypothetical protein